MKIRLCDCCKKEIKTNFFYKISKSEMEGQTQRLNHVADSCEDCFNKFIGKK
jgi:hypothetical protein